MFSTSLHVNTTPQFCSINTEESHGATNITILRVTVHIKYTYTQHDWMEGLKKERVNAGKNLKEPVESREEMRQGEKGASGQKQGRKQQTKRSEEKEKKKAYGGKEKKTNGYCMSENSER